MRMDRIDAMHAFVAVADLRGFAPAARKLRLSPSAVTRLIAALEERLGARLLQRTTRQVTLTDVGSRYLERARRILADIEEAEARRRGRAHAAERASGDLGAGRRSAGCMSAPLMTGLSASAIPMSAAELRLSDRMVNLVEDGVDLAVRIGHLAGFDAGGAPCRRDAADRGGVAALSQARAASRRAPQDIADARRRSSSVPCYGRAEWRFVEDGREIRVASTPRFATNSADAAIQYAEQGGGLTRVLAYQAADALKARAAEDRAGDSSSSRRCRSTSSIRPRGCCRPRCAPSSIS